MKTKEFIERVEELGFKSYEYDTAIEERKEEKRYYLKHRYLKGDEHLTIGKNNNRVILSPLYIGNDKDFKREFTLKEIKRLKKKLETDFKDFELIEVLDE